MTINNTLPEVIVTATRDTSGLITNPLHDYASYTYNISLWWLDILDYNQLMLSSDPLAAANWKPSKKSYCVAQDSGLYSDYAVPGTPGLGYNIQDVRFETTISPNKASRSSNMLEGSMTILEPYGITWFETLLSASYNGEVFNNWTQQPFMIQIDFKGYDDNGDPIPESETMMMRKRFPISILTAHVNMTNRGAEYKLTFCPMGAKVHYPGTYSTTPKLWTITADTVGKFFKELSTKYTFYFFDLVRAGQCAYAENLDFEIHPDIADSKIVNDKELPISRASTKTDNIELKETSWTIPAGMPILDIITKVMAHSDYLINDQLKLEKGGDKSEYDIFKAFKTTTKVFFAGFDGESIVPNVVDPITNVPPKSVTYTIGPYKVYDGNHKELPKLSDTETITVKEYQYYYSGKNTDIISLKLDFDTTYYTAIQAYTSAISATESSPATVDNESMLLKVEKPVYNPAVYAGGIPNITPLMFKPIIKDKEASSGLNMSSRPAAQVAADVMKSIYTNLNGDMLSVDMDIVGDPTLIKQDDWLYTANASDSYLGVSQQEYVRKYGHIKTDDGQVVVKVKIFSPTDIDVDWVNQGLMTPLPTYKKSIFSGQYKILTVINKFANGKFEQTLKLARYINSDIISGLKGTDAVSQNQSNSGATARN